MHEYNIQIVSQLTGISAHTLRAWERRYQFLVPNRLPSGKRIYTEKQIKTLLLIAKLIEEGHSIGKLATLKEDELEAMLENKAVEKIKFAKISNTNFDFKMLQKNIILALTHYKLGIISHELDKAATQVTPKDFALKIIMPLFIEIGLMVDKSQLNIAQEHALSAMTIFYISKMIAAHKSNQAKQVYFALATPKGELHGLGILLTCLIMLEHNMPFIYLGDNLPNDALISICQSMPITHLILGTTKFSHQYANYRISEVVSVLRENIPLSTHIWIGGQIDEETEKLKFKLKNIMAFDQFDQLEQALLQLE
jgi:DNA-binding transcriptional MerR regulator